MKTSDFDFILPAHLIASEPSLVRGEDRLMVLHRHNQSVAHHNFKEIVDLIPDHALLVFNDSKVRKARLMAQSEHGASVEFLLLEPQDAHHWLVLVSKAKRQKVGKSYQLPEGVQAKIVGDGESEGTKIVYFSYLTESYIERYGAMPLPPYMQRQAQDADDERYQTIYAQRVGSAAAPTAGLHFTQDILDKLRARGIEQAFVTLHVGLGTFAPVRSEILTDHVMHTEPYHISEASARQINQAMAEKRPIIAIGTTSCRLLESAMQRSPDGTIHAGDAKSNIFIYPGYQFRCITGLFTNFHTPKSTLLALVSALAGYDFIRKSYQEAIAQEYRFFSYGDAMLILP
ncbi:tRNA preQ1(34) S-adenosylmethionine ribosyltransferase-isomerase QueA [Entomospira culicis]|uniref:S-adenosylmethionine:tRNA ribosyltransferase-isomerase n=1 Tax=Entomospira culicis TaxID=2719989 RepID=A0A968GES8_9SPIO|nr:tRNA preQ1(34) S-adenosylmethionine ribosyltransferase-isomerase QueA [Entomospira culicis]NIZ18968.1 tRNA preQ1(34) S-adenosylmethionine ribosyltransferase-isomerase QueA [Entomospira culicis]NIZ69183.1 tRNA preQ1(34) S-adenosylmethionine ribosyltransferase-isomerase QueA [Entomospira culicis]WDI37960.1 tRNA preQ1(34) S-adenosylmethionine ribosyltransferase-isomerase QueA [Entomospira culicis]WDI39585.1 tRNA preQ1(34) S-adenosylmethionine ribosyltransferase-isomerase QueA [Entomospira culic